MPESSPIAAGGASRPSLLAHVVRLLDATLNTLNRPLAPLNPYVRQLIGLAALATILMSITASLVLPMILPRKDAAWFVRQRLADMHLRQLVAQSATTGEPGDSGHGESGGHGGGEHGAAGAEAGHH